MEQNDKSAAEIAFSAVIRLLPHASQLSVLLHLTKTVTRILAKDTTCHHHPNCRFGDDCWFLHPQLNRAPIAHNPYELAPSYSQRQRRTNDRVVTSSFDHKATETTQCQPCPERPKSPKCQPTGLPSSPVEKPTGPLVANYNQFAILNPDESIYKSDGNGGNETPSENSEGGSHEDDNSSRSWTSVRRKKRRFQPKINDETQGYAQICRDCSSKFVLSEDTKTWFIERQLHLPVRCSSCRHERKAKAQQDERHPSPPKVVVYPQNIRSSQTAWSNPAAQRSTARSSIHPSNNICSNDKLESKSTTASRKEIDEAAQRAETALIRDLLTNNTNDDSSPESREGSPGRRKSSQPNNSGRSASNESPCEVHEAPDSNHSLANPQTSESSDQRMPTNNANDDSSPGSREGSPERCKSRQPDYSGSSASSENSREVHEAPDSNHSSASSDQRMPSLQSGSESSASSNASSFPDIPSAAEWIGLKDKRLAAKLERCLRTSDTYLLQQSWSRTLSHFADRPFSADSAEYFLRVLKTMQ